MSPLLHLLAMISFVVILAISGSVKSSLNDTYASLGGVSYYYDAYLILIALFATASNAILLWVNRAKLVSLPTVQA